MNLSLLREKSVKITLFIFTSITIWYFSILFLNIKNKEFYLQVWSDFYWILALIGGINGIIIANKWGGLKSLFGRCIMMFSFGLLGQVFGNIIYSYDEVFLRIEVPYPSFADIGYFSTVLFYMYGAYLLAKVARVGARFVSVKNILITLFIWVSILAATYFIFLKDIVYDWSNPLNVFLDFGYPFGQSIYLIIAVLTYILGFSYLGGVMKNKILLLLIALVMQYVAEFEYLYKANRDLWVIGDSNEFTYIFAYLLMTLAIIQLNVALKQLQSNKK